MLLKLIELIMAQCSLGRCMVLLVGNNTVSISVCHGS